MHQPRPWIISREGNNQPSVCRQRDGVTTSGVVVLQISGVCVDVEGYVGLGSACCVA